jgi:hypothetical protein
MTYTTSATIIITNEYGRALRVYGAGPLWLLWDSTGITGVIRASSFADAWAIAEDEFFPEADFATWGELAKECGVADPENLMDDALFQENYGLRPNGPNGYDKHGHGVYQKDLNGDSLDEVTEALLKRLKLTIKIEGMRP